MRRLTVSHVLVGLCVVSLSIAIAGSPSIWVASLSQRVFVGSACANIRTADGHQIPACNCSYCGSVSPQVTEFRPRHPQDPAEAAEFSGAYTTAQDAT